MSTTPGLPWRRILGLHVVRHVEAVARARGLALGYVDAITGDARAAHAAGESGCAWAAEGGCTDASARALRAGDAATITCHRAVRELIAPISGDGGVLGALTIGGFV